MVWGGVVRCGVVWCGVVWCGVAVWRGVGMMCCMGPAWAGLDTLCRESGCCTSMAGVVELVFCTGWSCRGLSTLGQVLAPGF